jgi:hypothetical protein
MAMAMNRTYRDAFLSALAAKANGGFPAPLECRIWAVLMARMRDLARWGFSPAAGALTNAYCYMGISQRNLLVSIVPTYDDVNQQVAYLIIPFSDIIHAKARHSAIPGRWMVYISLRDGMSLKVSVTSFAPFTDMTDQAQNAKVFLELIQKAHLGKPQDAWR